MENKFTDYYRIGGIGGMVSGARQFESDIQRSLCVHREKKLIYYKPGKCAGTSLYHGILKPKMGGWITQKENEMEFNNWIANITDKEWESYYSFMFARNPFDRLVSCWNTIGRSMSFKDFVKSGMFTEEGVPKLLHYQTQISLLEVPDQSYRVDLNALLKVENINNDYKTLANEIGLPDVDVPVMKSNGGRGGSYQHYTTFYDYETVSIVEKWYERDLWLLGYEFGN